MVLTRAASPGPLKRQSFKLYDPGAAIDPPAFGAEGDAAGEGGGPGTFRRGRGFG